MLHYPYLPFNRADSSFGIKPANSRAVPNEASRRLYAVESARPIPFFSL
jgi:hypothetical protein